MCGVRENAVRRKLLQESGLTLSKCVDICRAAEATSAQLKEMAPSQQSSEVDLVAKQSLKNQIRARKRRNLLKISSSRNASFVAVSKSVIERNVPRMVKVVLSAENLITSL